MTRLPGPMTKRACASLCATFSMNTSRSRKRPALGAISRNPSRARLSAINVWQNSMTQKAWQLTFWRSNFPAAGSWKMPARPSVILLPVTWAAAAAECLKTRRWWRSMRMIAKTGAFRWCVWITRSTSKVRRSRKNSLPRGVIPSWSARVKKHTRRAGSFCRSCNLPPKPRLQNLKTPLTLKPSPTNFSGNTKRFICASKRLWITMSSTTR